MNTETSKKIKRFSDIIISIFLLILLSPLLLTAFLISILETGAFPIFIQKRGLAVDGKLFKLFKIRTVKNEVKVNPVTGRKFLSSPGYKEKVPRYCKLIRQYGIDELPQLVNVIKGEMSLIGPRPLDLFDLKYLKEYFPEENKEREQLNSKPGILGLWQLFGRRTLGAEDLLYWDIFYEKKFSLLLDIKIIIQTFSLFSRTGIKEDSILAEEVV
ncbi:MAG: sugar transferase [Ignavibacteriaceae bacterium]